MTDLLLLHGAIGSKSQFENLALSFGKNFKIHTLDFGGHGNAMMPEWFSIESFASEVLDYLDSKNLQTVAIFGYSMGGYVALYLAKTHPERVRKIMTLATKFDWTPEIAQREIKMLDADKIIEKIPAFAAELQKRHTNDWKLVLSKTAEMMVQLGNQNALSSEDFSNIKNEIRLTLGDNDAMVSLEETISVYRKLSNASLVVFPNTQHPIEKVNLTLLSRTISDFFCC